jgi:hypothetical protein
MKKIQVYLTEVQLNQLEAESQQTGLSLSEVIRRVMDAGLKNHG